VLSVAAVLGGAAGTPLVDSAVIRPRVINLCPGSLLTTTNDYPTSLVIDETRAEPCGGYASMHTWRFSEDGVSPAIFNNGDAFRFCADIILSGDGEAHFGLQISPWWGQDLEGRFELNDTTGFLQAYGGRLPPYLFDHSLGYIRTTPIHFEMIYHTHGLSQFSPATIEYQVRYKTFEYTSGPLPFDRGPEGASYGEWGIQNQANVGGFVYFVTGQSGNRVRVEWTNICFESFAVDVAPGTWSHVKELFR
jgi:hypothetical protein